MKDFAIGIPTLNRADLLVFALKTYEKDYPDTEIFIVDNGKQAISSNFHIINNEQNVGVAASWNILCRKIFEKHENALILNDDIVLGKKDIYGIIKRFSGKFVRATPDWCAFILNKKIWEKVGEFDEQFFPAYYEDNDYEMRLNIAKIQMVKTPDLNPFLYKSSQTLVKYPELQELAKKNKERFINKWGKI